MHLLLRRLLPAHILLGRYHKDEHVPSNTRVIQTGGDGINRCDLTILILAEIRLHTVENTKFSGCDRCCSLSSIDTASSCLTTNQANSLVLNKVVESSDCIGTTANTGKYSIRKFSFFFQNLFFDLLGNNCLKSRTIVGNGCGPMTDPST